MVVEGVNDIHFLLRATRALRMSGSQNPDRSVPDLSDWEAEGRVLFLPTGGAVDAWAARLAPLGIPEFHLLDRELPPETARRQEIVRRINARHRCTAVLTSKRSLENYLHPDAICAAGGMRIEFDDSDCVGEILARRQYESQGQAVSRDGTQSTLTPWPLLSRRARKRMTNRAKRCLNTQAVAHMTAAQFAERDRQGELAGWLRQIGRFANQ